MGGRMTGITPSCRPRRPRLVRDERGQGVVEFALILPVLLLVLVGILEFGSIYSNVISMRQGVREAGRQGSVGQFGSIPSCGLSLIDSPTANMQNLMCLTKDQAEKIDAVQEEMRKQLKALGEGNDTHYLLSIFAPAGSDNYSNIELAWTIPSGPTLTLEMFHQQDAYGADGSSNIDRFA